MTTSAPSESLWIRRPGEPAPHVRLAGLRRASGLRLRLTAHHLTLLGLAVFAAVVALGLLLPR